MSSLRSLVLVASCSLALLGCPVDDPGVGPFRFATPLEGQLSLAGPVQVVLKGAGKDVSGRGVLDAYQAFLNAFKAFRYDGVAPQVEAQTSSDEQGNRTFTWRIDYRPEVAPEKES